MSKSSGLLTDDEIRYFAERGILRQRRLFAILGVGSADEISTEIPSLKVAGIMPGELATDNPADRL